MSLPKDPIILLSYINTQLRDFYPTLEEFCKEQNIKESEICDKLKTIDYYYNKESNQFL